MAKKKKKPDDKGPGVPSYIVTFSDMITLLLTFFVLLISMASSQEEELFYSGQKSFKRALASFGLQGLLSQQSSKSDFKYYSVKFKHPKDTEKKEENDEVKDYKLEQMRRTIQQLEQMVDISPSYLTGTKPTFEPTNLRFNENESTLTKASIDELNQMAKNMKAYASDKRSKLYVVGFCNEASASDSKKWTVSALRARTVGDFLRKELDSKVWEVFDWGANQGGEWTKKGSVGTNRSDILIGKLIPE